MSESLRRNFAPYWARGQSGDFACWRWSFESLAAAQSQAAEAARELAARFAQGRFPERSGQYYGTDRPLREPVLQEIQSGSGELAALITRNSYGCLVLNAARLMFVDVDLPESPKAAGGGFFKSLFGRSKSEPAAPVDGPAARVVARAREWAEQHPGWGWRIYRTKAGVRLLATHALCEPQSAETVAVFEALDADPLYRRLCQTQQCFRARLTPKPWRCGMEKPPSRWPYASEAAMERWTARYATVMEEYATCKLLAVVGHEQVHPELQPLLVTHDLTCRADSDLPLA